MYCRECGNKMTDSELSCLKCGTKKGEGISYCLNCGFHTSARTEYCLNCGARQRTIIPQKVKDKQKAELYKQLKTHQTFLNIEKLVSILGILVAVILFAILVIRPAPDNIPDISMANGHDSMFRAGNAYYYDSSYVSGEVAEYWAENRTLISYIVLSLIMSISSFIGSIIQRYSCKKIKKKIKEVQ